jgi:hypothetical protein
MSRLPVASLWNSSHIMARTISRFWGVNVGAAHTREPRLSAASGKRVNADAAREWFGA